MIIRMDHINIVVSDLERAKIFFLNLGFEIIEEARLSGNRLSIVTKLACMEAKYVAIALPGAQTKLELIEYITPQGAKSPFLDRANQIGLRHIAFAVEDIHAAVRQMKARGVVFQSEIQVWEGSGKQMVYFYGPDGILLELAQYPDS